MRYLITIAIIGLFLFTGCQRGGIKLTPVLQGLPVPHDGYLISPEIYVVQGQPAKMSGVVVWINGLDPNSIGD